MRKDGAGRKGPGFLALIRVARVAGERTRGKLVVGTSVVPCLLGRSGVTHRKREGDGATPAGAWRAVALLQRGDRLPRQRSGLPVRLIGARDGWCDDPGSALYNRPVALPFGPGHERLRRDDRLYDLLVVLDYNLAHPVRGRGSAIFFHVAAPDGSPTAGCVAVAREALRRLVPRLGPRSRLHIAG